ncbi:hypothetical protein HYY69_08035 [Candidatus Woesearchaeota archaeon]|nr:hypothetical protein [Candidatus Woesearchaeota archaeon]
MEIINPEYKQNETMTSIKKIFEKKAPIHAVQLEDFFQPNIYKLLKKQITSLKYTLNYQPLQHHYKVAAPNNIMTNIFEHKEFLSIVRAITGCAIKQSSSLAFQLSWKDYEILHDNKAEEQGIELVFDATDAWNEAAGGAIIYKSAASSISIPSKPNAITIIKKTKQITRCIQYINHNSINNKKYLFIIKL